MTEKAFNGLIGGLFSGNITKRISFWLLGCNLTPENILL